MKFKQEQVVTARVAINPWIIVVFAVTFLVMIFMTLGIMQMRWEINRLSTLAGDQDSSIVGLNRRLMKQEYPHFVRPFVPYKAGKVKVAAQDFEVVY